MASILQTSAAEPHSEPGRIARTAVPPPRIEHSRQARLSSRASAHLDWIRGLAAAAVMFGHVRGLFFLDYPNLPRKSVALQFLYAVTALGHQAVMVFFVLSGFFIGNSVVLAVRERRWSWPGYLIHRVTRLQLVLLPALLLGALWDRIGMHIIVANSIYHSALYKFYPPSVAARSTVAGFFGNLFFLQGIRSQIFGSNIPLWSLSYEFWYYLLFPALVLAVLSRGPALARVAHFALAAAVAIFVGPQICLYFLIWLAGVAVAVSPSWAALRNSQLYCVAAIVTFSLFAGALAFSRSPSHAVGAPGDFLIGLAFALWLCVLAHAPGSQVPPLYSRVGRGLAGFSYTLYLIHFPALLLLRAIWDPVGDWYPDPLHLFYGACLAALMFVFALLVAGFTEGRTESVRRWLTQSVFASSRRSARASAVSP